MRVHLQRVNGATLVTGARVAAGRAHAGADRQVVSGQATGTGQGDGAVTSKPSQVGRRRIGMPSDARRRAGHGGEPAGHRGRSGRWAGGAPGSDERDEDDVVSKQARKLFEALDLDENGTLTREEVITALRKKGPSLAASGDLPFWALGDADASSELFDTADQNGDTVLTLEEFAAVVDRRFGWR